MARIQDLVELYTTSCSRFAERPFIGTRKDGVWTWLTFRQFEALVDQVRGGLATLGIAKGDRVAIISDNSVEWAAAAYATYGLGGAFVPMYQAQRPTDWEFILADCGAKAVFVANDSTYLALMAMRPRLPQLAQVIGISRPANESDSWQALLAQGKAHPVPAVRPEPTAIAGFIYTSGTTGKPKGALLSHENIASNVTAIRDTFPIVPEDRSLPFLPWAHAFGQTCELHAIMAYGASMALNDSLERLLDNLVEIKPTVLVAVPRIFNKIYALVNQQIAEKPAFLQKLVHEGVRLAIRRNQGQKLTLFEQLTLALDDKLVFRKLREKFGGRLRYVISGSATLSREVAEFIDAVGLPVYEGYGLTETSPVVTSSNPGARRIGAVGRVLPGVRVHVDTSLTGDEVEGEIVVYGPNVMIGYHNRPDENEKVLAKDGGLRTGDLGHLDADGFLYVTGRIKEQFKLENGKYVMPGTIEEAIKMSPYVANAMVYGDGRPFDVALIVINEAAVKAWAAQQDFALPADPTQDGRVRDLLRDELSRLCAEFPSFERPRDVALIREDFTVQNGLLTPTLKLKRREVLARYGALLDRLYLAPPPEQRPAA